jgi:hypothetical protein
MPAASDNSFSSRWAWAAFWMEIVGVVMGIKENKLPLAEQVVEGFAFDPGKPDAVGEFVMAVSPRVSGVKPLGN